MSVEPIIEPEDELLDAGPSERELEESSLAQWEPNPFHETIALATANGSQPASRPTLDGPVFVDLREIEAADVRWHDEPFLPEGELVTNNADGDTGKGLLGVHYGARFSRGEFGERRMVLFAVAEDAYETVLKPRLLAAEANLTYVRGLNWQRQGFDDAVIIPDDIHLLEQAINEMNAGFLVIDPLLSHLTRRTNSHTDHEVKLALTPLGKMAQRTSCTVLGNGHFNKDTASGARKAASGSTAFTNTPRVGLPWPTTTTTRTFASSK